MPGLLKSRAVKSIKTKLAAILFKTLTMQEFVDTHLYYPADVMFIYVIPIKVICFFLSLTNTVNIKQTCKLNKITIY